MSRIAEGFQPPRFADEEKTRRAFLLNIIVWALILAPLPFLGYTFVFSLEISERVLIQFFFGNATNIVLLINLCLLRLPERVKSVDRRKQFALVAASCDFK